MRSKHRNHCIELLRQGIVCTADTTLEKIDVEDPSSVSKPPLGNSGSGNAHTCRDWATVFDLFKGRTIVRSEKGWTRTATRE